MNVTLECADRAANSRPAVEMLWAVLQTLSFGNAELRRTETCQMHQNNFSVLLTKLC